MSGRRVTEDEFFFDEDFDELPTSFIIRQRVKDKSSIDRYSLDISGDLKILRTRYVLAALLSDISNPRRSFTSKALRLNTYSIILKENALHTALSNSDYDYMKLTNFSSYLTLAPIKRLYHSYSYEYYSSESETLKRGTDATETETLKSGTHTVTGSWLYRLSSKIYSKAGITYRTGELYNSSYNSSNIDLGIYYDRPIKAFDLRSSYNFNADKEERFGEFSTMLHKVNVTLTTRKLRIARLYAEYNFSYRTIDFNLDSEEIEESQGNSHDISNQLLIGGTGKLLKTVSWKLELEARFIDSDTNQTGAWQSVWFGETQWAEKIRHYIARGEVRAPLWRKAVATARGECTTGTTNSENVLRYFYEFRIRYSIRRNLNLSAWWREEFINKGWWTGTFKTDRTGYDQRDRYYEIWLTYLWRRTSFTMEYSVQQSDYLATTSKVKRLYLKASRQFWL